MDAAAVVVVERLYRVTGAVEEVLGAALRGQVGKVATVLGHLKKSGDNKEINCSCY